IHLELDQRSDLFARVLTGNNVRQVLDDRRHLLIDTVLDEGDRLRRKHFAQRSVALGQIVQTSGNKVSYSLFETFIRNQAMNSLLDEVDYSPKRVFTEQVAHSPRQQFVSVSINKTRDRCGRLLALQHRSD